MSSVARKIFSSMVTPLRSIFAIYFEMLRSQNATSREMTITPRILNLLERAVATHDSNVLLWRLYSKCAHDKESVLIRATSNCSWSKALACDRIRYCNQSIDSVLKFMKDKGIRIRTPIEEVKLLLTM